MHEILRTVGEALGIEQEYTDNWGHVCKTDPKTAARILEAKGIRVDQDRLTVITPPLIVSLDEMPPKCFVLLDARLDPREPVNPAGMVTVRERDDRAKEQSYVFPSDQATLRVDEKTGLLELAFPLQPDLDTGVYRFHVDASIGAETIQSDLTCFVCPPKAYLPPSLERDGRVAGISVALYGVRSASNWGVGDFGDLKKIIEWAAQDLRVDFVGVNPLHALFNTRPFNSSPYNPSSRFYRNFIYLDIPSIPEFAVCAKAKELLDSQEISDRIRKLQTEEHVNYEEVSALKLLFLREIFLTFMENQGRSHLGNARWTALREYVNSEGLYLERFATFCALRDHFASTLPEAKTWREWPEGYRNPESSEVKKFRTQNESAVLFWMFVQWQLEEQLQQAQEHAERLSMAIGLYHDEALAVDPNGADFWAWQEYFHDGFSVGAPPDAFAPDGQDWGFAPPDRDTIRDAAYGPFLKKLRTSCRHGGALRIDHVMQLCHLFWIPSGGRPADGVYVKDYEADLLNLIALESNRAGTAIIGEDLGTVPYDFRDRLMKKGVFSYRLFYFERDANHDLIPFHRYPAHALVSISTHDLPTLAGFWSEADIELRRKIGLDGEKERGFREERVRHKAKIIERLVNDGFLAPEVAHAAWESPFPAEELHSAVLSFLFHTPSKLVAINQEDIFLDLRQQNLPGTTWQTPNWVTKMRFTVEELRTDPEATQLTTKFRRLLESAGRCGSRME
jgi:4-alpha-glucanotransferase